MATSRLCSIPDCGKPATKRGWCNNHYALWRKHGDPKGVGTSKGAPLKFLRDAILTYDGDECLVWPFSRYKNGYGTVWYEGNMVSVHRFVCEEKNGPPPSPKHQAAHSCGRGHLGCVAPNHVSWKTPADNQADRHIHGTDGRGEKHSQSRLTEKDILAIRQSDDPIEVIASRYQISTFYVYEVRRKSAWAWLE